ncbi:MAG: hypothetical protein JNK15_18695 [Planctomycetes bacterium]|nr:hypothetical protein [Planctomycetota bacterium]
MKAPHPFVPFVPLAFALVAGCTSTRPVPTPGAEGFDQELSGWRTGSTGGRGVSATWGTGPDAHAISPPNVVSMQAMNHGSEDRFNLFWTTGAGVQNGKVAVAVRANGGEVDQGGGPMWRVQDENNYYLCRLNPLESNFRVYVVKDGVRRQLATAKFDAKVGEWHRLEAVFDGARIVCSIDGKVLLEASDGTIGSGGGHGLWTKADALTSFDDFVIEAKN